MFKGIKPKNVVQNILNAKCVQCHSGGQNEPFAGKSYTVTSTTPATGASQAHTVPYLDLSERPVTVVYDRTGKELWRHQGRLNRDQTIAELRKLLRRIR